MVSLPRSLWTPFQEKSYELDQLKKKAYQLMGDFNLIVLDYHDWFDRRHQAFLDAIKSVELAAPTLVADDIRDVRTYREMYELGLMLGRAGFRFGGQGLMEQYLSFWTRLLKLKETLHAEYLTELDTFCSKLTRLRHPHIKEEIDSLHQEFCQQCTEMFDFKNVHNERENLFTYKLTLSDQRFLGLVGFIPYILTFPTRICYLVAKLYIEKL